MRPGSDSAEELRQLVFERCDARAKLRDLALESCDPIRNSVA
jgi:hypothetical protein